LIFNQLIQRSELTAENFLGIMLDPTGLREYLPELLLRNALDDTLLIEEHSA
jgi:hypothetical protein